MDWQRFRKRCALSTDVERRLLGLCLFLLFPSGSVHAQRLLELGSVIVEPAAAGPDVVRYAAQLDMDLVRAAPGRLELPVPEGRPLVAELSVFEDRGDGDVMWAGRVADSEYESVVFSVVNGYLAGHYAVPGGANYRLSARPDGQAQIEDMSTLTPKSPNEDCPGGVVPDRPLPETATAARAPGSGVAHASHHNQLDIMVLYNQAASRAVANSPYGSMESLIQAAIDNLNMVFRNGQLDVVARLVHRQSTPASLDTNGSGSVVLDRLQQNQEVRELRREHNADLVHLFVTSDNPCGRAYLLQKGDTWRSFSPFGYAMTSVVCFVEMVFAHEIGHNLGASHDPPNDEYLYEQRHRLTVQPYAFGHSWFDRTVMSLGRGTWQPWFSTVRVELGGAPIGVANERENERAMRGTIGIMVRLSDALGRGPGLDPRPPGSEPAAPRNLTGTVTGPASVRLSWVDRSGNETGFEVQFRQTGSGWRTDSTLPANSTVADVTELTPGKRYDFRVRSFNNHGRSASNTVTIVLPPAQYTDCVPTEPLITFEHGYTVSMCVEYLEGGVGPIKKEDARDYRLDSRESGILYFFDRDNAEVLVKVLDACAVNGYRWVFVAPVTDLAFNLYVDESATGERWTHRNPRGGVTATTASDVTAFPCATSATRGAIGADIEVTGAGGTELAAADSSPLTVREALTAGEVSTCLPQPVLVLRGGYEVSMCVEFVRGGKTMSAEVKDYGLKSEQSAVLYFFERDNAEVLIKVLNGCGVNGHRWVFVAPVTDLAFNLRVQGPAGEVWTHVNRLGQTADAKGDTSAFPCSASS